MQPNHPWYYYFWGTLIGINFCTLVVSLQLAEGFLTLLSIAMIIFAGLQITRS